MRSRLAAVLFIGLLGCTSAVTSFGQSAAELEQRYGATKLYAIGSSVLVRPHYDKSGKICWAELIPNPDPKDKDGFTSPIRIGYFHADPERLIPSILLNSTDVIAAFNELAPPETRKGFGTAFKDFSGFGTTHAVLFRYENILFSMTVLNTNKRGFPLDGRTFDTAFDSLDGEPIGASIQWTDRTCSNDH